MAEAKKLKVRVYHSYYGCDTGCCGHIVEVDGEDAGRFSFNHPYDADVKTWARKLVEKEVPAECLPNIDWDSLDVSEVVND